MGWVLASACAGSLAHAAVAAPALDGLKLDPPTGPVLLSLSGEIARRNDGADASFDMALLQKLPQTTYVTKTPWYPSARKFTGVLVRDLFDVVGATPTTVRAVALNDYRVEVPAAELVRHRAMVAWLLDDAPMAVRDKGPLVIMFPFSDDASLRTAVQYGRAVWQLRRLELR